MIDTELYELAHGKIKKTIQCYIDNLELYFKPKLVNVVGVTILPNFCVDHDMTHFIHSLHPETKEYNIFRGILVELRSNYLLGVGDIQFIHPQLYKQRAILEVPTKINQETVIARIKDIQEMNLDDVGNKIENTEELMLSPLYNSLNLYETTYIDKEWGTNNKKLLLGYDLSCDKFLINFWMFCLQKPNYKIAHFYNDILTTKIQGTSVKNLIDEQCSNIMEYITGEDDSNLEYVSEITTNYVLRNDEEYFVYNHGINLLGLSRKPTTMQVSTLAGLKVYKNLANNQHPYKFVFPYDSGFTSLYHSWDQMNNEQKRRLQHDFYWSRHKIPFNTYLMSKVNNTNNDNFRKVETTLQVIPDQFYNLVFSRVSTHDVYDYLNAKDIVQLQPGNNKTEIFFPIKNDYIIMKLLFDNYKKLDHYDIINPKYYCKKKQMLKLPREIASFVLSFE